MKKIERLKKLAEESGNEKIKELVLLAEDYMKGLEHLFRNRDIDAIALKEFDIPMYLKELEGKGLLAGKKTMADIFILVTDVFYVVRHTWEFTDERGKIKNGDDLHKAAPFYYESAEAMDVESLFKDIFFCPFVKN